MKTVVIIISYFGEWPQWMPIFLASCRANPTITWHIHTDCPVPRDAPQNVHFFQTTFEHYKKRVRASLGISFNPQSSYKLCDLKPAMPFVHQEDIASFDYVGWGDLDVIYGNIRKFYTDEVLTHNVLSTHRCMTAGHLTLMRNEPWLVNAFRRIPHWETYLADPRILPWNQHLSEPCFTDVVWYTWPWWPRKDWLPQEGILWSLWCRIQDVFDPRGRKYRSNNYFKEQYTTPFKPERWLDGSQDHPETWYWKDGRVFNDHDGDHEFIYLHLMNFVSARWTHRKYRGIDTWKKLPQLMHVDPSEISQGVKIDRYGIHPMSEIGQRVS